MPYIRNSIAYDHDFWYTCVKWWYHQVGEMPNEILGNQYKDFAIKAQRPNIYRYTKSYKTQIKRMTLIKCQPKVVVHLPMGDSVLVE